MAKKANAETVNAEMRPPDYRYAVQMIRGDLEKKKDRVAGLNGEMADIWAKIESRRVNKTAAKFFGKIDKLEGPERLDVLRSLNGLCDASGWPSEDADLVDEAEGNVVPMRVGKVAEAQTDASSATDAANDFVRRAGADKRAKGNAALEKVKSAFAKGQAPAPDDPETYEGDDDDLAGVVLDDDETEDPDAA